MFLDKNVNFDLYYRLYVLRLQTFHCAFPDIQKSFDI